jgi:hypothetical protein
MTERPHVVFKPVAIDAYDIPEKRPVDFKDS